MQGEHRQWREEGWDSDMKETRWRSHTALTHLRRHPDLYTHTYTHIQTEVVQQREVGIITAPPTHTDLFLLLKTQEHNEALTGAGILPTSYFLLMV